MSRLENGVVASEPGVAHLMHWMPSLGSSPRMRSVFVQAPDEKSEELVPSPQAWPTLSAKGDLKLLAEEQVLDHRQLVQMRAAHIGQTPR